MQTHAGTRDITVRLTNYEAFFLLSFVFGARRCCPRLEPKRPNAARRRPSGGGGAEAVSCARGDLVLLLQAARLEHGRGKRCVRQPAQRLSGLGQKGPERLVLRRRAASVLHGAAHILRQP